MILNPKPTFEIDAKGKPNKCQKLRKPTVYVSKPTFEILKSRTKHTIKAYRSKAVVVPDFTSFVCVVSISFFFFFASSFLIHFCYIQGRFEILSLSGSCTYTSGNGGAHRKDGMLSVSLAKPDGRVFGGGIESSLIAAGPIQVRNFIKCSYKTEMVRFTL